MELHNIAYRISYRSVKYPRLEFKTGTLSLVLPIGYNPDILLKKHRGWILKKVEFIKECLEDSLDKELAERTEEEIRDLVYFFAERVSSKLGVKVNKIYLRKMKSKWASCSSRRNLTINKLMKYLPENLIEYAIFHEIAHIIEKRHNDEFWRIISKRFSNYQELERDLFIYWFGVARIAYETRPIQLHPPR